MIYLLYDIVLALAAPLLLPYYMFRLIRRGKFRRGIGERLGRVSGDVSQFSAGGAIWVHAVSVGETVAVKPLLAALKSRYPARKIVLTSVTETGRRVGEALKGVDRCIYFPFDFSFAVRRVLRTIRPSLIIVVETEIWPNFLRYANKEGIPVVLANGRISDKSLGGYRRFSWFFRVVLDNVAALCMQTEEDAHRIIAIGAPPSRVHVACNLKYDIPVNPASDERKNALREVYRVPHGVEILTAGSTHQGEEEMVLSVYKLLIAEGRELFLVLAPRHPERAAEVSDLMERLGIPYARRSSLSENSVPFRAGDVLLVDTVGELMGLYSISDLVFVGGSLVPVGGHNILEPASLGVTVLFGPHMKNFREIASRVLLCGGGVQVDDVSMLGDVLRELLDSPSKRASLGNNGMQLLKENRGSTERHMEVISALLDGGRKI
jgi:3-deoxy-D-manno-octulosonic-acid transferase